MVCCVHVGSTPDRIVVRLRDECVRWEESEAAVRMMRSKQESCLRERSVLHCSFLQNVVRISTRSTFMMSERVCCKAS